MGAICVGTRKQSARPNALMNYIKPDTDSITQEEAYIIMREESLGLHTKLLDDLLLSYEPLHLNRFQDERHFMRDLQKASLLPEDFMAASKSIYWTRFYSKFKLTSVQKTQEGYTTASDVYDKFKLIVGFTLLTQDWVTTKSDIVFQLMSKEYRPNEIYISIDSVRNWITLFLNIACNYLVVLAQDYPSDNKTAYYKMYSEWNKDLVNVADQLTLDFMGNFKRMSQSDFMRRCSEYADLFNTIALRRMVKVYLKGKDNEEEY